MVFQRCFLLLLAALNSTGQAEETSIVKDVAHELAHDYGELTNTSGEIPVAHHPIPTYRWNLGTCFFAVLLVLCPAFLCAACAWKNYLRYSSGLQGNLVHLRSEEEENLLAPRFSEEDSSNALRMEVLLMLLCPLLPLLAAPWTTCARGSPSWLYALYLPILARSKCIEYKLMKRVDVQWTSSVLLAFVLLGPLEHLDWFTDGTAPLQAWACDAEGLHISQQLAMAWAHSSAAWIAPLVAGFQVSGLLFVILCFSAGFQQLMGSDHDDVTIRADLCSMLGLAELKCCENRYSFASFNRSFFVGLSKVLCENVPQLVLQTSFLALVWDDLAPLGRTKMLLSVAMGLLSASQKILKVVLLASWIRGTDRRQWFCISVILVPYMLALLVLLWTFAKVYFIFHCETHLWNFSTGCVDPP